MVVIQNLKHINQKRELLDYMFYTMLLLDIKGSLFLLKSNFK